MSLSFDKVKEENKESGIAIRAARLGSFSQFLGKIWLLGKSHRWGNV